MSIAKDQLHKLIDSLPEERTDAAFQLLARLVTHGKKDGLARSAKRKGKWPGDGLLRLAGIAQGPEDLAERHDYYLAQEPGEQSR